MKRWMGIMEKIKRNIDGKDGWDNGEKKNKYGWKGWMGIIEKRKRNIDGKDGWG